MSIAEDVSVVGDLVLTTVGSALGVRVTPRVIGGELERTMDGASTLTLTIEDADRALLRSGLFDKQIDLSFDKLWWRSVKVSKQGDELTITFEDRAVALLRQIKHPRKASRSEMTRAQFALSIVREVKQFGGITFICPELNTVQPIETSADAEQAISSSLAPTPGIAKGKTLYLRDGSGGRSKASTQQLKNAERVLNVAVSLKAGWNATIALLEAVQIESLIQNLPVAVDLDSRGILQVRDSTAGPMGIDNLDIEACCNAFLKRGFYTDPELGGGGAIAIANRHPDATPGRVAQATQGSAHPERYDRAEPEARALLEAFGGASTIGGGSTVASAIGKKAAIIPAGVALGAQPFQFQRGGTDGKVEDSWSVLQSLADEVKWRCYASGGAIIFASETALISAKPRAVLSEASRGVFGLDFDVDNGKENSTATVTVRAFREGFPPGSVVELEDCGPADGRWLVQTVRRGIFDAEATLDLKRPTAPLPEPSGTSAADGGTDFAAAAAAAGEGGLAGGGGALAAAGRKAGLSGKVARAYQAAQAIHAKRLPYVWGGGHAHCGVPDHGLSGHADSAGTIAVAGVGYDCSGSTCAVLAAAGMGYELRGPAEASGPIAAHWGKPGEGSQMTVWANENHVFIEFHTKTGHEHFGTGDFGKGWDGPGFNPNLHTHDGFYPRHWPEDEFTKGDFGAGGDFGGKGGDF